jgi:hypothetical protein
MQNKIPNSHLLSSYDVIDSFFKWKPPIFFLDSDSPFKCHYENFVTLHKEIFEKKKNKFGKIKLKLWNLMFELPSPSLLTISKFMKKFPLF